VSLASGGCHWLVVEEAGAEAGGLEGRVTALAPVCRFLLSDAKGRFGGVVRATSRTMPMGLLAQDEPPPPPPPPLHLPRISNAVGALGTCCSA